MFKTILQSTLASLARATLKRYKPLIVAITGSVGKTSTKDAIFAVLKAKYRIRRSEKNYNTEIGVPLTVLGIPHYGRNIFRWLSAFIRVAIRVLIRDQNFPEILVLEMAADRPGDIAYLVKLAPPFVGVITAIGEIPVHVEFFAGPSELSREKAELIRVLPAEGYAVLNADDAALRGMKSHTRAHTRSFGFGQDAELRITNYELRKIAEGGNEVMAGISFKLEQRGSVVPVRLHRTFGKQQAYAAAAAAAVGLVLGMNLVEIAAALKDYESPPGRLKLLRGNKQTWILDDAYNASPASTHSALEVLVEFPARRRIAVLGDMLELGTYTEAAHRAVGARVAEVADVFIGVGERMRFVLDEARSIQTFWFSRSEDAGRKLEELLEPGDVVLVKGSQAMRMEKIVKEVMAEPERAKELLVRQDDEWFRRP